MPRPADSNPFTGRVRRVARLRQALALIFVVAAAAVLVLYIVRRRGAALPPKVPVLGLAIQQSASGVTISKSENGRPIFRVHADRVDLLRASGEENLHHVLIEVYGPDGHATNRISGEKFGYSPSSYELQAEGRVQILLDAGSPVQAQAADLAYNVRSGQGSIAGGLQFKYLNATGSAQSAQLDAHVGSMRLQGVQVTWKRPGQPDLDLASAQAVIQKFSPAPSDGDAAMVTLSRGARVVSGQQSLAADTLVFHFRSDQTLRTADASGQVRASDRNSAHPLEASADRAQARFVPYGPHRTAISVLNLDGAARLVEIQSGRQSSLTAGQFAFSFDSDHRLRTLHAVGAAHLSVPGPSPASAQIVSAPELDFVFLPGGLPNAQPRLTSLHSVGRAQVEMAQAGADATPVRADADQVRLALDSRQRPTHAFADGNVQVTQTVAGEPRTSRSDHLELVFVPGAARPELQTAIQTGHVELRQGGRTLAADALNYAPATRTAILTAQVSSTYTQGEVRGRDAQTLFQAPTVRWTAAENGGGVLTAGGGVSLRRSSSGAAGPDLLGGSSQPLLVTARSLVWTEPPGAKPAAATPAALPGTAVFIGGVRLMQSPNLLFADKLTLNGAAGRLDASGHVETDFVVPAQAAPPQAQAALASAGNSRPRSVLISASDLEYDEFTREATYTGAVVMQAGAAKLTAPKLQVWLAQAVKGSGPGRLERALASGGVQLSQPGRTASSSQLRYDFARDRVELAGGPPSIFDAEQGRISGDPLTFSLANDEIQVGSQSGARAVGQTVVH